MFRAAVLSIVLTLAVGPGASLLCRAWCDPHAAAASGCHPEPPSTSASVAGADTCTDEILDVSAVLRDDIRRVLPSQDGNDPALVTRYRLAAPTIDAGSGQEPEREWSLARRPLSIALRL